MQIFIHKEQLDKSCAAMCNLGTNSFESNLFNESVHKSAQNERVKSGNICQW